MTQRCARWDRRRSGGFALAIVLWVLAGLAVVAAAVASTAHTNATSTKLLRDRVRAEAAFISTAARVQMLASTGRSGRTTLDGPLGTLPVDGRDLRVEDGETVQPQELRGLVDLNLSPTPRTARLLEQCGVDTQQALKLADALADYVDEDGLKRINGAEAFDYRAAGKTAPRNARLLSRDEVWRVLGWSEARERWLEAGCDRMITVHGDGALNRNTAPAAVLRADGLDDTQARALVDARRDGLPSIAIESAAGAEASNPFGFTGGGFAGRALRVSHSAAWVEWSFEYDLELTPLRNGRPWRLHEVRVVPRTSAMPAPLAVLPPADFRDPEHDAKSKNAVPDLPFGN